MNELIILIKDLGFPIFVAVYFMFVLNKRLKEITGELKRMNYKGGEQSDG